jgi:hypothetical protein
MNKKCLMNIKRNNIRTQHCLYAKIVEIKVKDFKVFNGTGYN